MKEDGGRTAGGRSGLPTVGLREWIAQEDTYIVVADRDYDSSFERLQSRHGVDPFRIRRVDDEFYEDYLFTNADVSSESPPKGSSMILFGASSGGEAAYGRFSRSHRILCFCDNDESKWGSKYMGLEVVSPKELVQYGDVSIVVSSIHHKQIISQLESELSIDRDRIYLSPDIR